MNSTPRDWEKLDGKRIKIAYFINQVPDQQPYIAEMDNRTLTMVATDCGDRLEMWIIEEDAGKERARHNLRAIESIFWHQDSES